MSVKISCDAENIYNLEGRFCGHGGKRRLISREVNKTGKEKER